MIPLCTDSENDISICFDAKLYHSLAIFVFDYNAYVSSLGGGLSNLPRLKSHKRKRFSSYDRTGGNRDFHEVPEGVNMFGPSRFNSTYGVIEPEFLRTQIYDDFAPSISIDRQASIIDEDKIQVTISVRNEHTASISEVVVNDSQSMRTYPSAKLSTGTSTVNLGTLSPKETKSMTYTIQIKNSGQYTLSPVKTSFTYESYSYTEKSLKDIVRTNPPSSIQLAGLTWSSFGELLNRATNGSGSVVQMGIIGIFVILIGFSAFKNVIKPRMNTQSEA